MVKKRKPKSKSNSPPSLSDARYQKLLIILLEAWESAEQGQDVFWDFGSGERPKKIIGEFQLVAKKESIPVKITNQGTSLRLKFPEDSRPIQVRVKSKSGQIKAQVLADGMGTLIKDR